MRPILSFQIVSTVVMAMLLSSCEKKEDPISLPATTGIAKQFTVKLGRDYTTQMFFRLSDGQYKSSDFQIWDLAFQCGPEKNILINGGKEVQVANTGITDFSQTPDPTQMEWEWDNPAGEWEGTAFGKWCDSSTNKSYGYVFLIDRGPAETRRYIKMKITSFGPNEYHIQYANPDGTQPTTCEVEGVPGKNYVYFNFDKPTQPLDIEPERDDWDIQFARYRHVYYDMTPITPYSVTGVLLNPFKVVCAKDSVIGFDHIDAKVALKMQFCRKKDMIGFDWKKYDMALGRYSVKPNITYVIRDTHGFLYKMRFIDFYDEQGVKGAPKFELQRL